MNPTEKPARQASGALFDEGVLSLALARKGLGEQSYFPLSGDPGRESYFENPAICVMAPADFEFPGGGTPEGLVDALEAFWTAEGEAGLAAMAPRLREIATELRREATEADGEVSILCYTMF